MPPGKHLFQLQFNQQTHSLYQHSYDGFGLMQGRKKITHASKSEIDAPCIPLGRARKNEFDELVVGSGKSFSQCSNFIIKNVFDKSRPCDFETCSFDGIYMPSIDPSMDMYAFSYFYDICNIILNYSRYEI